MRGKKLLAMLLALCLVVSAFSPAFAVNAGENTVMGGAVEEESVAASESTASVYDKLVASEQSGIKTLSDADVEEAYMPVVKSNGTWSATESTVKPSVSLVSTEKNASLEELKVAAELYATDEVVSAFVVMEDAPLAEIYTSRAMVNTGLQAKLIEKQDNVIAAIESDVLGGSELDVRYQFTYLTNSFTIKTEFGNLAAIAEMPGVKSVFLTPMYETASTTADPNTAASGAMTGVADVWQDLGYTGTGMKIAIIDTGLDLDHPSFAADPETNENSMTVQDVAAVLGLLNAYDLKSSITATDLYRSAKIPFAFNYVDKSLTADHSKDQQGDHGTHVSGIAAANAVEGTTVVGMAPDAQIIVMKVFGAAHSGAAMDDIVAALEDAMTLGCDVVNASLGSSAGFSDSGSAEMDAIFARIASQDIVACFSAGNEGDSAYGNMWGTDMNRTSNPDNATVGSPSTYVNVMSIASAENSEVMTDYFSIAADEEPVFFQDSIEALYASAGYDGYYGVSLKALAGIEYEYVIIDGLGAWENYYDEEGNSLVEGKIAVVKRGELSFAEKVLNAQTAGAAGVIIWNSNDTDDIFSFGMTTTDQETGETPYIPSAIISLSDGQRMADAEVKTMVVAEEQAARKCEGGQMSSFSSWGVSPDLGLSPDITGIGGNVFSCYDGGTYGLMSGTSMSSPQLAGISALVMQHLYTVYPDAPDGSIRSMTEAILMSTADPIINTSALYTQYVTPVEASPRQQGAGLVNALDAVTTTTYLTVGGGRPKAELGDGSTGVFTFSFEIHNFGDTEKSYTMNASLLTEYPADYTVEAFMYGEDMPLSGSVTFDQDVVVVPAGSVANVKVTIELSADDMALFNYYYPNGGYVEGFVYLYNEEGASELSLPFLGFYGDWTEAPVFDSAYWCDNSFWGVEPTNGLPEGDQYYHIFWTDLAGTSWVLGFNPYSGALTDANGDIYYNPACNVVSPNGDGLLDGFDEIYLSLLRNAKTLTFTYTVDGEIVHQESADYARKTMYYSSYGRVVPWLYSWYGEGMYDFTDAMGNVLPSGTEVLLTIDATVDYGTGGDHSIQIPVVVDTKVPELVSVSSTTQGTTQVLAVEVSDDYALASVVLMNPSGTRIYGQAYDVTMANTENGTSVAYFDVTNLGTEFTVAICDYGCNESYYAVTHDAGESDNLPEMDTDSLYAYRVLDYEIYSDHMFGWVEMNKPASAEETADITVWTDDYLEYAAINAAEYVDGKIFAVDAVYNLVVMDPGLFDRHTITNLGINVLDMTFDDSTDTMYVLGKTDYDVTLYSMDLLTGALTVLKEYGYFYYSPWAIADDDNGTIYAVAYQKNGVYTLDVEDEYAMVQVLDSENNPIAITDSNGANVTPTYAQSMTWENGTLYWAYFSDTWRGITSELISINTSDWTFIAAPYSAVGVDGNNETYEYTPYTELVGLITLTETDYQIPESSAATSILLDAESVVMQIGERVELNAYWLPWNYDLNEDELVWTSSDESIVTISDGLIVGVGHGKATVTVTYGELSATCEVTSVDVNGNFYAYAYYSADGYTGYFIDVDKQTMDYGLVTYSPVDFVAGDYNGHDGCFYGYDANGQLYRLDFSTGDVVALGEALGTAPVDMAYDYSTGYMYVLFLDQSSYLNTLYQVNMNSGKVEVYAKDESYMATGMMTLACTTEGVLYSMNYEGYLCQLHAVDYSDYGMGVCLVAEPVMEENFGSIYYLQSMCWDHNNDVIVWDWVENFSIMWVDPAESYSINLGDPTGYGLFEYTGMFIVPDEIPALADTAVESVSADDILILTGYEKPAPITVYPFNATCQNVTLVSADTSVVEVTAAGNLLAVAPGTTTVTATLEDTIGETSYEVTFTVKVLDGADNMYGHLLTDLSDYNGQFWIELFPGDTKNYAYASEYFEYTLFTSEYVDGKIYTYGYDAWDWTGNQQYFILDAETFEIETQIDMGDAFPFVYDMTYDYVTSTMYLLAGVSSEDTQLYMANMETGEIVLLMDPEPMVLALAAGPEGKLYAIENSVETFDWETWTSTYSNANLHVIDPLEGTIELIGDTGLMSNMISSMAYDWDTDTMYWTPFAQTNAYISSLAIVDLETAKATSLGSIGVSGSQVGGLYILCDEYPEADTSTLHNVVMSESKATLNVGETSALNLMIVPGSANATIRWTSSDRNVATVDSNGVVTAVAQGQATITATVKYKGVTKKATCTVAVLDAEASFLTYNVTDGGWAHINRGDYTVVTNLNEGEEVGVNAMTSVGTEIYGYDANNNLFMLNTETYERTEIGAVNADELVTEYMVGVGYEGEQLEQMFSYYTFDIRDMAYDAVNDRVLVLGSVVSYDPEYDEYSEMYTGTRLYEADLATGTLERICTFEDDAYVMAITVDKEGTVYYYNTFNDYVNKLDTETGTGTLLVSLQTQSLYGESTGSFAMHYDVLTDTIYMTFTSNGRVYKMITVDTATGALADCGIVGETETQGWYTMGDAFVGLTFVYVESDVPADPDPEPIVVPIIPSYPSTPSVPSTPVVPEVPEVEVPTEPEVPVVVNPFSDVEESDYYYNAVLWAVENGITTGTTETTFDANTTCTRGQIVTFLWRAAGSPVVDAVNPFADVVEGSYYYNAVLWAVANGITTGTSETTFAPEATCTRGQVVTFMWRAAGSPVVEGTNPFADVTEDSYYYNAVLWAVANGITTGTDESTFAPEAVCTRSQVVTFLWRAEEE